MAADYGLPAAAVPSGQGAATGFLKSQKATYRERHNMILVTGGADSSAATSFSTGWRCTTNLSSTRRTDPCRQSKDAWPAWREIRAIRFERADIWRPGGRSTRFSPEVPTASVVHFAAESHVDPAPFTARWRSCKLRHRHRHAAGGQLQLLESAVLASRRRTSRFRTFQPTKCSAATQAGRRQIHRIVQCSAEQPKNSASKVWFHHSSARRTFTTAACRCW